MTDNSNFVDLAQRHSQAIDQGDDQLANTIHNQLSKIAKRMQDQDYQSLKDLANHPNESVRLWSAVFIIKVDADLAIAILEDLKKSHGILALTASTTLDMYKKGMM